MPSRTVLVQPQKKEKEDIVLCKSALKTNFLVAVQRRGICRSVCARHQSAIWRPWLGITSMFI